MIILFHSLAKGNFKHLLSHKINTFITSNLTTTYTNAVSKESLIMVCEIVYSMDEELFIGHLGKLRFIVGKTYEDYFKELDIRQ